MGTIDDIQQEVSKILHYQDDWLVSLTDLIELYNRFCQYNDSPAKGSYASLNLVKWLRERFSWNKVETWSVKAVIDKLQSCLKESPTTTDLLVDAYLARMGRSLDKDGLFAITDVLDRDHNDPTLSTCKHDLYTLLYASIPFYVRSVWLEIPRWILDDSLKRRGHNVIRAIEMMIDNRWMEDGFNLSKLVQWTCDPSKYRDHCTRDQSLRILEKLIYSGMFNLPTILGLKSLKGKLKPDERILISDLISICGDEAVVHIEMYLHGASDNNASVDVSIVELVQDGMERYRQRMNKILKMFLEPKIILPRCLAEMVVGYLRCE